LRAGTCQAEFQAVFLNGSEASLNSFTQSTGMLNPSCV
jgi:hypothetical protein